MQRLYVDLKEDCHGDIVGTIKLPYDNTFTLEALAGIIEVFSNECGVEPHEILNDIGKVILK